jgi:hypothetical protein
LLWLLCLSPLAQAIQLRALYTASCQREVGIVLNVTPRQISLLNLQGKIVNIERFEVIYYATFLVDTVPIEEVKNASIVPMIAIKTYEDGGLVTLVRGWPVDFNKEKVAFLTLRGSEVMIDRSSIWGLDYEREHEEIRFQAHSKMDYRFAHPYAFASCEEKNKRANSVLVNPQQILNDPISIKRELDRLAEGHAQMLRYISDQQFYPVPEVYKNETQLGLWLMGGARYGASHNRTNNFTPYLVNQFSSGPFGFQSEFKTGSGPLPQSIHEETQEQIYFRMKADYFHFTAMVDPNLLLVGTKYNWSQDELSNDDIRANESAMMELGFDYGKFAFEFYPGGALNMAAKHGSYFQQKAAAITRAGIRWQGYKWLLNVIVGGGSRSDSGHFTNSLLRVNVEWTPGPAQRYQVSFIARKLHADAQDALTSSPFEVESTSTTFAGYGYFRFKRRYWAGVLAALEHVKTSSGISSLTDSSTKIYPKLGGLISLSF